MATQFYNPANNNQIFSVQKDYKYLVNNVHHSWDGTDRILEVLNTVPANFFKKNCKVISGYEVFCKGALTFVRFGSSFLRIKGNLE
jgi:hypothetical protein